MNVTEQFTWVIAVEGKFNMNWIGPLFTNAAGWSAYVSYKDGVWYVDKENPIKIGEGKSGMMLLPIMEKGYGENYEYQLSLLREGLESIGIDPDIAKSFPFHVPVLFAFKHRWDHWADMATDWINHIELNHERAKILFDSCQDKVFSQRTRQVVLKFVNSWTREQGYCLLRLRPS